MHPKLNIRSLYCPIQPTVKQMGDVVSYLELTPAPELQPFIYCYWELNTKQQLTEHFNYKVVADGCIDLFFDLNNPRDSFVMGFCKKYTEFKLENEFHYVGIRFLPTMFPALFDINAKLLSNQSQHLDSILPVISNFIYSYFSTELSLVQRTDLLNNYFLNCISTKKIYYDARIYNAIHIILNKSGVLNIEKDLNIGLSSRQLRRLFDYYIGDSQKTFSQVVRFQNILKAKPSVQSLKLNKLFFEQSYYDQAHFIKNFKNFYGLTPAQAFNR